VNLAEGFASFDEQWSPRLAGELRIELRDESNVVLEEGEFVVVTRASNTGQSPERKPRSVCSNHVRRYGPARYTQE
jgi:hypothetical protein